MFEALRSLRREKAEERGLPPFIVFSDATLRDMARRRPSTSKGMLRVHGIGEKKLAEYGEEFLDCVADYCRRNGTPTDVIVESDLAEDPRTLAGATPAAKRDANRQAGGAGKSGGEINDAGTGRGAAARQVAIELYLQGRSLAEVSQTVQRAPSTTAGYVADYIAKQGICDPGPWVDEGLFERIAVAVQELSGDYLKPLHEALAGDASYEQLRVAVACLRNAAGATSPTQGS